MEIGRYQLLASAIERSKWSASRSGCINPKERAPVRVFWIPEQRSGEREKSFAPYPASNHDSSVVYLVAGERQVQQNLRLEIETDRRWINFATFDVATAHVPFDSVRRTWIRRSTSLPVAKVTPTFPHVHSLRPLLRLLCTKHSCS